MKEPVAGRGSDKYSWIANEIRSLIASGKLAPGSQLPQRVEMEESFGVSKVTLQRAMNLLIEDGFVDATRRKGSFVAENPPHLHRYLLVFQTRPDSGQSWLRFWTALSNEARRLEETQSCRFFTYYGIDGHTDTLEYQRFAREINEHRVAGVIYVSASRAEVPDIPVLRDSKLPRITVKSEPRDGWPALLIETEPFLLRALDYVRDQGRSRVALLAPSTFAETRQEFFLEAVAQRSMASHSYWTQGVGLEGVASACNCVHLLMRGPADQRPDALIISDDNLVEPATRGLVAAGVRVPLDAEVVAHANFPWVTPSLVPAKRLGYDVRGLMRTCLETLDQQRLGRTVPAVTEARPLFDAEVENS